MKYQYLIILSFLSLCGYGQTKIFDKYDFEAGNFSLVFLNVELIEEEEIEVVGSYEAEKESEPTEYIDNRKHYIIESNEDLAEIKKSWVANPVDYKYMCWYDYFIYLLKEGEVVSEMRANFECKELLVDGVPYEFDSTLITSILPQAERIYKIDVTYDSIDNARSNYDKSINDPEMLMITHYRPNWSDFNGLFEIEYLDHEKTDDKEDRIANLLRDSGLKDFKLSWAASGMGHKDEPNDHWYRVFSNEQPDNIIGLNIRKNWKGFDGPFKATYVKKNTPNRVDGQ